ncbi:AMP-binding enzyme [Demequina muriae]|uniref:AMP-binding protein n=1 Tax=Demequina muriae TaxID=3051664 RepID=A0ABT8GIG3_9MICO|nr:AMP-binding protein [Demequina sp. EGI L300058]MDN4480751.1 AMP-binding protein [Demequina sp. EGI L300058]
MNYARLAEGGRGAVMAALSGHAAGIAAPTSGSTGDPREVLVGRDALIASATATLDRLGGPGHWLLALPTDRIAGAMVIARAHVGGGDLIHHDHPRFTPASFAEAAAHVPAGRRYVSLVPTQVWRLLSDPRGADALATFDAVLVGGAAPGMALPAHAIETYGMTETSGGCVYDGRPLDGASIRIDDDGRILLAGPMLADGYADGDDSAFIHAGGERWLRTGDLGSVEAGSLTVMGRADDVILSGGVNVHPLAVEKALRAHGDIADAAVVGTPDAQWGERVVAVVVPAQGARLSLDELRSALALDRATLPTALAVVDSVPRTAAGKIDRYAARAIAARIIAEEAP